MPLEGQADSLREQAPVFQQIPGDKPQVPETIWPKGLLNERLDKDHDLLEADLATEDRSFLEGIQQQVAALEISFQPPVIKLLQQFVISRNQLSSIHFGDEIGSLQVGMVEKFKRISTQSPACIYPS